MTADLARLVDDLLGSPAVVYGSLPPHGRDLDLVLDDTAAARLRDRLLHLGFDDVGGQLLRIGGCGSVDAIDLSPIGRWGVEPDAARRLVADAVPLDGYRWLRRPDPASTVLLLARRVARTGRLDERRRTRLHGALAEDPAAWERAAAAAPEWSAERSLTILRALHARRPAPTPTRVRAVADELRARGRSGPRAAVTAVRMLLQRPPRGVVIAFSGLEGAGKSTQVESLRSILAALGWEVVTSWRRLSDDRSLERLGRFARNVVRRVRGREWQTRAPTSVARHETPAATVDATRTVEAVRAAWATVVAASHGLAQRRTLRPHLRVGRIVVCDRYTLDAFVHLRFRYGTERRFVLARTLLRTLAPPPVAVFLLDVPARTSWERRRDHYRLDQLADQRRLYADEHARWGVVRLDGTAPAAELCETIAVHVVAALGRRS